MDDGYKMNGPRDDGREKKEIALFLGDDGKKLRAGGGELYDVDKEFRKTRKNRSLLVPLSLVVMVILMSGLAWGITGMINRRAKSVEVDIRSFEDLKLRDLLDSAKRYDADLDRATRELAALEGDRQSRLESIEEKRRADLALLEAVNLPEDERARRRRNIEGEAAAAARTVRAALETVIQEKKIEIAAVQKKIASYDARSVEEARKQQEVLDNQQRLYELEKQRLTSFYQERLASLEDALRQEQIQGRRAVERAIAELSAAHKREVTELTARYNPAWKAEEPAAQVLSRAASLGPGAALPLPQRTAPPGSPVAAERVRAFAETYDGLRLVLLRLAETPYLNSVPQALSTADASAASLGQEYLTLLAASAQAVSSRNARIGELERSMAEARLRLDAVATALTVYVRSVNAAGIVVEGSGKTDIALFIDPQYMVDAVSGRSAWIFRGDDEPVAEVVLERRGETVFCRILRMEDSMAVLPFDKVLLNLTNRLEVRP